MNLYNIEVLDNEGNTINLKEYEGKVLLIVNTATGCGFTPQYDELQDLYEKYNNIGLEILDFPCNQFMNQASGTQEEIHSFCTGRYGITFKQFLKIDVKGKNISPLFKYLKESTKGIFGNDVKWNFTKFLINKKGEVVARYAPTKTPLKIENEIKKLLEE